MDNIVYVLINYQDFARSFVLMKNKGIIKEYLGVKDKSKIYHYGRGYADALGLNVELIKIWDYDDMEEHRDFFKKIHSLRLYNSVREDIIKNIYQYRGF